MRRHRRCFHRSAIRGHAAPASAFERARAEALRCFGDATVLNERLIPGAHRVEGQIIADHHGAVWAVGVRDCSIQRGNHKLIEESSSPALSPGQGSSIAP